MIGIIDYGLSNLACVKGAVSYLGYKAKIIKTATEIDSVSKIILPGVGAFPDAMTEIKKRGIIPVMKENIIKKKKPFFGICLGAQLICNSSDEYGHNEGLGWVNAEVRKIKIINKKSRIPHTGWNNLELVKDDSLFDGIGNDSLFYFTHSHAIFDNDNKITIAYCKHQEKFSSVIKSENIYATQFHPEKSQKFGLKLLDNFLKKNG